VLIPGSLEHWFVFSYILALAECGGQVGSVDLNMEDDELEHYDKRMLDDGWKFMYDFPDHNAHHSSWEMQLVVAELGNLMQTNQDDMLFALKWVIASFDKMKIDGTKVKSGLYSGWRGTTWINTVLNHCYMTCARQCFMRLHGYEPLGMFMGVGDDVDSKVREPEDGYKFFSMMLNMGYEDNEMKQLLADDLHEFLRTIFCGDHIMTCVNRALPAYVSGDFERQGATFEDKLKSDYVNIHMLRRRGMDDRIVAVLEKCSLSRWGRVKVGDSWKELSKYVLHGRESDGGLGVPDETGDIWVLRDKVPRGKVAEVKIKPKHADLTREMIIDKVGELREIGFKEKYNSDDILEYALSSHGAEDINRIIANELGERDFSEYWNFKTEIVEKVEHDKHINEQALRYWLRNAKTLEVISSKKKLKRFGALKDFIRYTDGTKEKLEAVLADGKEYYIDADRLTFDIRVQVAAPEFVVSSVLDMCKSHVLSGQLSINEAKRLGESIVLTYVNKFKNVKL
jgi:hypothetical protein